MPVLFLQAAEVFAGIFVVPGAQGFIGFAQRQPIRRAGCEGIAVGKGAGMKLDVCIAKMLRYGCKETGLQLRVSEQAELLAEIRLVEIGDAILAPGNQRHHSIVIARNQARPCAVAQGVEVPGAGIGKRNRRLFHTAVPCAFVDVGAG